MLRAAIEESLRWTPPTLFARFAARDTTLGGFDVPRAPSSIRASAPRTGTRSGGTIPTGSTPAARCRRTSGSAAVPTSASACTWPGPRCRRPSRPCSPACPISGRIPGPNAAHHWYVRERTDERPGSLRVRDARHEVIGRLS